MARILKVILVHIAITMLIAFVLPSSQPPLPSRSSSDSTVWDYQHSLLRPSYPPQDLQGNYLSPDRDQLTRVPTPPSPESQQRSLVDERGRIERELSKLLEDARDATEQKLSDRKHSR
jgi:hypothetical protein